MQPSGAYVDQIPAGAKPPTAAPPAIKITPGGTATPARPPPPGLYVQVASVTSQEQAIHAGLDLAQRLGRNRPPFIRGEAVTVEGQRRLRLFAGPFPDEAGLRRFCAIAIPGEVCLPRVFVAAGDQQPSSRK